MDIFLNENMDFGSEILKVNMVYFNLLSLLEASFLVFNIEINILLILIVILIAFSSIVWFELQHVIANNFSLG